METQQVAFRFPNDLLERLDLYATKLNTERPGVTHTRADAVRVLLNLALDAEDKTTKPTGRKV